MGYRSDVTYVFYTMKPDVVPFPVLKLWFDENYPKHDFCTVVTGNDYIMVSYDHVKWYAGYPEVVEAEAAVTKFMETFDTDDTENVACEMALVGEELNDIVYEASPHAIYRLGVNRDIYFH
jgi:hypothetical protein